MNCDEGHPLVEHVGHLLDHVKGVGIDELARLAQPQPKVAPRKSVLLTLSWWRTIFGVDILSRSTSGASEL